MVTQKKELTGKQKAAALLISMGPDISAQVYKHLTEEEIEQLTLEISSVKKVDPTQKEEILEPISPNSPRTKLYFPRWNWLCENCT